jgi:NAD-dependent SIR2 family protein deacetylase
MEFGSNEEIAKVCLFDLSIIIPVQYYNRIPVCLKCGGNMKPDVVFFGDNVPSDRSSITNDVVMIGSSNSITL